MFICLFQHGQPLGGTLGMCSIICSSGVRLILWYTYSPENTGNHVKNFESFDSPNLLLFFKFNLH